MHVIRFDEVYHVTPNPEAPTAYSLNCIDNSTTKSIAKETALGDDSCTMADTTTKQSPQTYVGTSKVVQTDYPVC